MSDLSNLTAHTSTPWIVSRSYCIVKEGTTLLVADCAEGSFNGPCSCANAEFIVRAVNAHDVLVAALGAIHTAIDELDRMSFGDVPKALDKISTIAFDALLAARSAQ